MRRKLLLWRVSGVNLGLDRLDWWQHLVIRR
jgi:hypothetical protein